MVVRLPKSHLELARQEGAEGIDSHVLEPLWMLDVPRARHGLPIHLAWFLQKLASTRCPHHIEESLWALHELTTQSDCVQVLLGVAETNSVHKLLVHLDGSGCE
jgi:hypothetical protein